MVEDYKKILSIMKDLKPYLVEFKEDRSIMTKNYLDDCTIKRDIRYSIIVITHNKYTFSVNNGILKYGLK